MPKIIAVVTSAGGAALTDIKNVLARRCPMVKLLLIPALVQGAEAPESVAAGIRRAQDTDADVIIFGRQARGGSSCFNSEVIARAVYASRIPTISAVGHERDYGICDYAAVRADSFRGGGACCVSDRRYDDRRPQRRAGPDTQPNVALHCGARQHAGFPDGAYYCAFARVQAPDCFAAAGFYRAADTPEHTQPA
ncbi:MAG: exodeoxyribonuclease VII large subunit [Oscillospiraceae bacterium]